MIWFHDKELGQNMAIIQRKCCFDHSIRNYWGLGFPSPENNMPPRILSELRRICDWGNCWVLRGFEKEVIGARGADVWWLRWSRGVEECEGSKMWGVLGEWEPRWWVKVGGWEGRMGLGLGLGLWLLGLGLGFAMKFDKEGFGKRKLEEGSWG